MHMYFWWDYYFKNFLFQGWDISTVIIMTVTCFGLLGFSLLFEWVKMAQAKVRQKRLLMTQRQLRSICPSESDTLISNNTDQPSTSTSTPSPPVFVITRKDRFQHFVNDMGFWLGQNIMGYLLMLTVMLYNGYMVIAIIIGSTIGYYLFGPALIKINIENCRALRSTFCMADCGEPDKTALLGSNTSTENRSGETSPVACHPTTSTIIPETTEVVIEQS